MLNFLSADKQSSLHKDPYKKEFFAFFVKWIKG